MSIEIILDKLELPEELAMSNSTKKYIEVSLKRFLEGASLESLPHHWALRSHFENEVHIATLEYLAAKSKLKAALEAKKDFVSKVDAMNDKIAARLCEAEEECKRQKELAISLSKEVERLKSRM